MIPVAVALTVGSRLYDRQCVGVRLRRAQLPALDRLEVLLPVATEFEAAPGDDCELELDGGDGASTVFSGRLTRVTRSLRGLELTAHNGGRALAESRPVASFEQQKIGEIIDRLCSDAEVTVSRRPDGGMLALHVLEGRGSAAEEIARLASWVGAWGAFDGGGELHVNEEGGPGGELALRYGRELLTVEGGVSLDAGTRFTVVGDGAGDASSPEGRWVTTDFTKGSAPSPAADSRRVVLPALRTTEDARSAADGIRQAKAVGRTPVRLKVWLNPDLQPGMRLELADLPDHLHPGFDECRVRQVISTVRPGRAATTEVWATSTTGPASGLPGGFP